MTATPPIPDPTEEEDIRPFSEFLHLQRGGEFHEDATQALHRLLRAVQETGRPGELTIKISVKMAAANAVLIRDAVAAKSPAPEADPAYYYLDGHHNLRRSDPNQPDLPLRELPTREPREVQA
jgi:hypothetical protein